MATSRDRATSQSDDDLPPGEPVVGNDANSEPGAEPPLDDAPVATLTEPGDTPGG